MRYNYQTSDGMNEISIELVVVMFKLPVISLLNLVSYVGPQGRLEP